MSDLKRWFDWLFLNRTRRPRPEETVSAQYSAYAKWYGRIALLTGEDPVDFGYVTSKELEWWFVGGTTAEQATEILNRRGPGWCGTQWYWARLDGETTPANQWHEIRAVNPKVAAMALVRQFGYMEPRIVTVKSDDRARSDAWRFTVERRREAKPGEADYAAELIGVVRRACPGEILDLSEPDQV